MDLVNEAVEVIVFVTLLTLIPLLVRDGAAFTVIESEDPPLPPNLVIEVLFKEFSIDEVLLFPKEVLVLLQLKLPNSTSFVCGGRLAAADMINEDVEVEAEEDDDEDEDNEDVEDAVEVVEGDDPDDDNDDDDDDDDEDDDDDVVWVVDADDPLWS